MARRFLILLPLLAVLAAPVAAPVAAQPTEAVRHFDAGHQRFIEGDYRGALADFEAAQAAGYASGLLYYNMGNAYYRLDEVGQAIRYYEKARRLMPEHRELAHNLDIARARTVDAFAELPTPFWVRWWERVVAVVGAWGLFGMGMGFYLLAAILVGRRIWKGRRGEWHRRGLALTALAGALFLVLAFAASFHLDDPATAVLLAEEVPLRATPAADAPTDLTLHEGLLLDVLARTEGWTEVRLPNGTTGWLPAEMLAEI